MQFYDFEAYGCQIRNECVPIPHWHTVKPDNYDAVKHPGNWLGFVAKCSGDLAAVTARRTV